MKILLVGAGGVGSAFCAIAARRDFFEAIVVADYAFESAERAVAEVGDQRFSAAQVDAADAGSVER
ncbi:MAG: saccharopine dehydrogenase NADP-binding domain-containing protein, partial [Aeromicrobium sp.]